MRDINLAVPMLIDRKTAKKISGFSESWQRHMDSIGAGPPKLRLGRGQGRIRYPYKAYVEWLQKHLDPAQ
jgi:hypothetical protein